MEWNHETNNASKQFTSLPSAGKRQSSLCTLHLLGQTWWAAHYYGTANRKVLDVVCMSIAYYCVVKSQYLHPKKQHFGFTYLAAWLCLAYAGSGSADLHPLRGLGGSNWCFKDGIGLCSAWLRFLQTSNVLNILYLQISLQCQLCSCHSMWKMLETSERFPAVAGRCALDGRYEWAQLLNLSFGIQHLVLQFGQS